MPGQGLHIGYRCKDLVGHDHIHYIAESNIISRSCASCADLSSTSTTTQSTSADATSTTSWTTLLIKFILGIQIEQSVVERVVDGVVVGDSVGVNEA
ncbi:hypothetical protein N7490_004020 [Penicillium lividum]|nr:hypothetical protein N7490_004020 [Penicillium lividum]